MQLLQSSGVPEALWESLTDKIRTGDVGAAGAFEVSTREWNFLAHLMHTPAH